MSVQKFLDKIKNGRYGADITDAIIGGIKKCYDDASVNHDNANMEVKMARGTHNTLNDRLDKSEQKLDETNAQLSQKANKNEVFSMANMGQDIREAMTGGSVAVVGRDSVLNENIVDEQISTVKMSKKTRNLAGIDEVNLINRDKWLQGSISSENGSSSSSTTRIRCDYYLNSNFEISIRFSKELKFKIFEYAEASASTFITSPGWIISKSYTLTPNSNHYYRMIFAYTDDSTVDVNDLLDDIQINTYESCFQKDIELLKNSYDENASQYLKSNSELVMSFPAQYQSGSYAGDMCFVGKYLFCFNVTDDDHLHYYRGSSYIIDVKNKKYELFKRMSHNFGHCNSMDYCEETDTLIFGNGSGDFDLPGKIYLYQGFLKSINSQSSNEVLSFNLSDCIEIDCSSYNLGAKFNVVWGEDNNGRYDMAYLITNNNNNIRRIQLGKGINNLGLGKLIVNKTENDFNGTFKIQKEFEFNTGVLPPDNAYCVQGADYHNGYLYVGIGHGEKWYWKFKVTDTDIIRVEESKQTNYNSNGDAETNQIQGICLDDDFIVMNLSHNVCIYRR